MHEHAGPGDLRAAHHSPLIGSSRALTELRAEIERIAAFREPVLVLGETGTGKELVARVLHERGPRSGQPLQLIHCAGISGDVLASELFGHAAGAFTGASCDRRGRIRAGDGSTVVLDEITETPSSFQAAILRAIEYGEVQPLGRDDSAKVDVRFVATSNRPLAQLARGEGLRHDLFHRLAAFVLVVPPLRERPRDVLDLAHHFLEETAERYGRPLRWKPGALDLLAGQPFPGNVRELRQVVVRAYAAADGDSIDAAVLRRVLSPGRTHEEDPERPAVTLEQVIRRHIAHTLRVAEGNLSQAARLLDVPRSTLQHYLVKYRVEPAVEEARRRAAT